MAAVLVLTGVSTTVTIAEALDALGWTASHLAAKAGLDVGTVMRAMIPNLRATTNDTSADAIAAALGLNTRDIEWANGVSTVGRRAATGVPIARRSHYLEEVCPEHYITLPNSKVCDMCS